MKVPVRDDHDLGLAAIESAIGPRTRAVIVNTPNNPTGRIYPPGTLSALADLLTAASRRWGRPIWLISDEPYARLVFSDAQFHSPSEFYPYTVISYSYGKVLLTPGERIGWLAISPSVPGGRRCARPSRWPRSPPDGCFRMRICSMRSPIWSGSRSISASWKASGTGWLPSSGGRLPVAFAGGHVLSLGAFAGPGRPGVLPSAGRASGAGAARLDLRGSRLFPGVVDRKQRDDRPRITCLSRGVRCGRPVTRR